MEGMTCDRCRKPLLVHEESRYIVRIEVLCAYDPMEITEDDLARDHEAEIRRILMRMEGVTEQEAMDQVYRKFLYDLCPPCQREFLRQPLGHKDAESAEGRREDGR